MSDLPARQVQLQFPYIKGRIPTYANAVLLNRVVGGVLIDFGFFDPFIGGMMTEQDDSEKSLLEKAIEVEPLERLVLSLEVAEQLSTQLKNILDSVKREDDA